MELGLRVVSLHAFEVTLVMPFKPALRQLRLRLRRGLCKRHRDKLIAKKRLPATVLFYHRVADESPNDWTINCRQFTKQMRWLKEHTECVDLATVQYHIKRGSNRRLTSVTFDDGYADNSTWAIPLLQQLQIPCTYFVSTEHVRTGLPFQHDVDAGFRLPVHTPDEVKRIADRGVEIGCHTRNHVDFATIDDPRLIDEEVAVAKDELERMIGGPVRYFAVPFGMPAQLTPMLIDAIRRAGFKGFTSAYGDYNEVGGNDYHIKRVHGDSEWSRFEHWLNIDPSKQEASRITTRQLEKSWKQVEEPPVEGPRAETVVPDTKPVIGLDLDLETNAVSESIL